MIVPMQKILLLCTEDSRESTLERLRTLGVLHLQLLREPASQEYGEACRRRDAAQRALAALEGFEPSVTEALPPCPADEAPPDVPASPAARVEAVIELEERQKDLDHRLRELLDEQQALEPWGDFDPAAVDALRAGGVIVKLCCFAPDADMQAPEGVQIFPITDSEAGRCVALAAPHDFEPPVPEADLPGRSLAAVQEEVNAIRRKLAHIEHCMDAFSRHTADVRDYAEQLSENAAFLEARDGMGSEHSIAYLEGFCPRDRVPELQAEAKEAGWGLIVRDPEPDEKPPTLLRYPAWVKPISSLFKMLDVIPGYREVDTSPAFMIFFSIFFGVLVNDAGYGLFFLLLTIALRLKFRKAPPGPFTLFGILSVSAIVWGILTGSYFGIEHLPAPLRGIRIDWLTEEKNVMAFAFFLGAIHLTLAHAWKAFTYINSTRALAQLGWIGIIWSSYFAARMLILNLAFPGWCLWVFLAGILLVILFMTPLKHLKSEWSDHIMLPFDVIASFADLVSYVRLFAVGTASMAVAEAFNELALQGGVDSWLKGLVAVVILLLGHGLNIILALMSILVHGVRLNTLEFSSHVGLEWTGFRYEPFSSKRASGREAAAE